MRFQTPLIRAKLIRRYKRFLADIVLEDGRIVTAHCANPGAMTGLAEPGTLIWVEPNNDAARKLKFSWKLVELAGGHFACVDTALPNTLVSEALAAGRVPGLGEFGGFRREVRYGEKSRIDFLLSGGESPDIYVEVKAVTLRRSGVLAEFPDTRTTRGTRHLDELADAVSGGFRAAMLYVVHRTDCEEFRVARDVDPEYAAAFDKARRAGVQMLCQETEISVDGVSLARPLAVLDG